MTLAQLMALLDVEMARQKPQQAQPADPSEWIDWGTAS